MPDFFSAMTEAGKIHLEGKKNQPKDYTLAKEWFEKALNEAQGTPLSEANFYLGKIYTNGLGVEEAAVEGFRYYEKAALLGHKQALEKVATTYATGNELIQYKPLVAARMYERLVANGQHQFVDPFIRALYESGDTARFNEMLTTLFDLNLRSDMVTYYRSVRKYESTRNNDEKQRAWRVIERLANRGHSDALAYIMQNSKGATKPTKTLKKLADTISLTSSPEAYFYLALCGLQNERWELKSPPDAMIRKAAEAGVVQAIEYLFQADLAQTTENRDKSSYIDWLKPKAQRGIPAAQELMDRILQSMEENTEDSNDGESEASGYGTSVA